jgi:hypothetical protein
MTPSNLAHFYWRRRGPRCHLPQGRIKFLVPDKLQSTCTRVHDVTPHKVVIFNLKNCKVIPNIKAAGWYRLQIRDFEPINIILRNLMLQLYDRRWGSVVRVRKKDCKNHVSLGRAKAEHNTRRTRLRGAPPDLQLSSGTHADTPTGSYTDRRCRFHSHESKTWNFIYDWKGFLSSPKCSNHLCGPHSPLQVCAA